MIILGSTSPVRKELLARLELPFTTFNPNIDETPLLEEPTTALVKRLAQEKAKVTALSYPHDIIITADTVGELNGKLLNKPLTHENAYLQLQECSNQQVRFYTGLCLLNAATQSLHLAVEHYDVYFRPLTSLQIHAYLHKEKPYHCAGSLKAEGFAVTLIRKFSGEDFSTLLGLPLIRLVDFLNEEKILTDKTESILNK